MVRLFEYEGYEVNVQPEALLLIPFQTIWDRDTSKGKSVAKQELAYIYFMADPRSDYQYLVDEEVRAAEIIKGLGMPEGWRPDEAVQRALTFYASFKPVSAGLLEDTRYFINAFRKQLRRRSDDLDDMEMKELKEAMAMMKQIPGMVSDLDNAERTLSKDLVAEEKARGSQQKAILEDEE